MTKTMDSSSGYGPSSDTQTRRYRPRSPEERRYRSRSPEERRFRSRSRSLSPVEKRRYRSRSPVQQQRRFRSRSPEETSRRKYRSRSRSLSSSSRSSSPEFRRRDSGRRSTSSGRYNDHNKNNGTNSYRNNNRNGSSNGYNINNGYMRSNSGNSNNSRSNNSNRSQNNSVLYPKETRIIPGTRQCQGCMKYFDFASGMFSRNQWIGNFWHHEQNNQDGRRCKPCIQAMRQERYIINGFIGQELQHHETAAGRTAETDTFTARGSSTRDGPRRDRRLQPKHHQDPRLQLKRDPRLEVKREPPVETNQRKYDDGGIRGYMPTVTPDPNKPRPRPR